MNNIVCVLDACSIINLICIDEDDFLVKKLQKYVKIWLCEEVVKEIKANIFKKENLKAKRTEVDEILGKLLYSNQKSNNELIYDCGNDFFHKIHEITSYTKKNGEFYSSALALYLSQTEEIKLFFHTDDSPAQEEFRDFFAIHQIGGIKDTADLLMLLYRLDDLFLAKDLTRFLDALYKEYARDITICLKELRALSTTINSGRKYSKKKNLKKNLDDLINKLDKHDKHDFSNILDLKNQLKSEKDHTLNNILQKYESVFMLSPSSNRKENFLKKIKHLQQRIKEDKVYKILS